ncbi:MAG: M16 family metallopeptidase, partial [Fusobacteriota bacterium]
MAIIKKTRNNIPVILEDIDHVKSVSIGVFVKTGSKNEKENESGISHFVEHMLFKGTKSKTAQQISEKIDQIGGNINAFTNKEMTGFYVTLLSEHIDVAIETLSDIIINSTFPAEEIEKEKKVIIEEIKMYKDIPEEELYDLNFESVLEESGVANSVLGTIESVSSMTQKKLINYWKERYAQENLVISVSGQVDINSVFSKIENNFKEL